MMGRITKREGQVVVVEGEEIGPDDFGVIKGSLH